MRVISYNVNGIRAAINRGFLTWLEAAAPDVLCLQEVKALPEQVPVLDFQALGYELYWHPAEKKGYSGVAIFSKQTPDNVVVGMGHPTYDREGRVIRADFGDLSVLNTYFPSGTSGDERQDFKYRFLDDYFDFVQTLRASETPNLLVVGDYNICHQAIDIHNPLSNKNSSGFLPEERAWMDKWFDSGMIDTFREFNPDPHHYSWWSYRANARSNNKGWRIDYISATEGLRDRLQRALILPQAEHSDHCPVFLEIV